MQTIFDLLLAIGELENVYDIFHCAGLPDERITQLFGEPIEWTSTCPATMEEMEKYADIVRESGEFTLPPWRIYGTKHMRNNSVFVPDINHEEKQDDTFRRIRTAEEYDEAVKDLVALGEWEQWKEEDMRTLWNDE